ncbi:MAG: hypothetical protein LHV69_10550 [Elusimicrobia bacterium]|nr:hypothetical protein [Candidatus Obscuribacterium magneticum]
MGHPEKDRIDASNQQSNPPEPPQLDAVLPDAIPTTKEDVFREIDDYQRKIELEWEKAKKSYQEKIDTIMDDFIQQNAKIQDAPQPTPTPEKPPKTEPTEKKKNNSTSVAKPPSDSDVRTLISNVQNTLEQIERKSKQLAHFSFEKPSIINVPFRSHRPWVRRILALLFFIALSAGLGYLFWTTYIRIKPVTALPYPHTSGLIIKDNKVYIVDWFRKALFVHTLKAGFPLAAIDNFPNPFSTGFVMTNKILFSINGFDSKILEHALTSDHHVLNEIPFPGGKPSSLFWDGQDIWAFDKGEGKLIQFQGTDFGEVKSQHSLSNVSATAIQVVNNRVWILDGKIREIGLYRLQDPLRLLTSFDLDPFIKGGTPTGFCIDKRDMWVVTEDPPRLIRIGLRSLKKSSPINF